MGKLNLSECLKMFNEMQLFKICPVHCAGLPPLMSVIKCSQKATLINANLALCDELHN